MRASFRWIFAATFIAVAGCAPRSADFTRQLVSPSGRIVAHFEGYQPRGTIEGYLTVAFSPRSKIVAPQLTFGHMLMVKAGWLDEHTFVFIYDLMDQRDFASPLYPTGEAMSAIQIITCNRRYVDCTAIAARLSPARSIVLQQFPEGSWPT